MSIKNGSLDILQSSDYTFNNGLNLLVAHNGMGKTTLLRALVDLIPSKKDSITFDDKPLKDSRGDIFFYEKPEWFDDNLNAWDYLRFIKSKWNSSIDVMDVIKEFNMTTYYKKPIRKYSLGMKQRLLIGMYAISDAKIWLMDEINNGLDVESRKILYEFLERAKQQHKTMIVTTHYKSEISGSPPPTRSSSPAATTCPGSSTAAWRVCRRSLFSTASTGVGPASGSRSRTSSPSSTSVARAD